jgi:hypothetical protein
MNSAIDQVRLMIPKVLRGVFGRGRKGDFSAGKLSAGRVPYSLTRFPERTRLLWSGPNYTKGRNPFGSITPLVPRRDGGGRSNAGECFRSVANDENRTSYEFSLNLFWLANVYFSPENNEIRFQPRRLTEERCRSIKLETSGFSIRDSRFPHRTAKLTFNLGLTNGGPSTHEGRMRSSPRTHPRQRLDHRTREIISLSGEQSSKF